MKLLGTLGLAKGPGGILAKMAGFSLKSGISGQNDPSQSPQRGGKCDSSMGPVRRAVQLTLAKACLGTARTGSGTLGWWVPRQTVAVQKTAVMRATQGPIWVYPSVSVLLISGQKLLSQRVISGRFECFYDISAISGLSGQK